MNFAVMMNTIAAGDALSAKMTGLARIECDDALIGCNDALAYFELVVILQMIFNEKLCAFNDRNGARFENVLTLIFILIYEFKSKVQQSLKKG